MSPVAATLIVAGGGALMAGIATHRAAVARGQVEPLTARARRAVATVRGTLRPAAPRSSPTPPTAGPAVAPTEAPAPGPSPRHRPPAGARGFLPALEGLRGLAAVGVLTTHVAFVTRTSTGSTGRRLLGRLDLAVAVFFAKSAFLLWRPHAAHARTGLPGAARPTREFARARLVRIMPAYVALVGAAMLLLPQNHVNGPATWLANLSFTQIYTDSFLVAGLTHAWSLSVEMAYYAFFPVLWTAMRGLSGDAARWRIPVIGAFGVSGLAFPLIPWHALGLLPAGVNVQILPPAFAAWFAAGLLLAELATAPEGTIVRLCRDKLAKWGWWAAGGAALVATTIPRWFSEGFVHPRPGEFSARTGLAALMAFLVLAPVTLSPEGTRFRLLESAPLQSLGRWSYGIFLWHLLVLHYSFPLTRTPLWTRRMAVIWPVAVAGSVGAGAASYRWLEEPARRMLERR